MTNANKVLVTHRRFEFFVLRRRLTFQMFCAACGAGSDFVSVEDAVLITKLSTREIVRLADCDAIHFTESIGGHLFICCQSLHEREKREKPVLEITDGGNDTEAFIKSKD